VQASAEPPPRAPAALAPQQEDPASSARASVVKYIKVNGLMQKNPAYTPRSAASAPPDVPASQPIPAPAPGSVPKYIKMDGLMQKNPAHPDNWPGAVAAKMAAPANALTPIYTMSDIVNQNACGGEKVHLSAATEKAFDWMQDTSTLAQYAPGVDCGELVDELGNLFARYHLGRGRVPLTGHSSFGCQALCCVGMRFRWG
jgi:hypothetical protein